MGVFHPVFPNHQDGGNKQHQSAPIGAAIGSKREGNQ
jgi:hypothetical protein